jgi:hypothetical protein
MKNVLLIFCIIFVFIGCSSIEESQYTFKKTFDYNTQYKCEDGNVMLSWLSGTGTIQNNKFYLDNGIKAQITYLGMQDSSTIILRYSEEQFGNAGYLPDSSWTNLRNTKTRTTIGIPDYTYDAYFDIKKTYMIHIQGFAIHITTATHHFLVFEVMKI